MDIFKGYRMICNNNVCKVSVLENIKKIQIKMDYLLDSPWQVRIDKDSTETVNKGLLEDLKGSRYLSGLDRFIRACLKLLKKIARIIDQVSFEKKYQRENFFSYLNCFQSVHPNQLFQKRALGDLYRYTVDDYDSFRLFLA